MRIFAEWDLRDYLSRRLSALTTEVGAEQPNRLLNVNETQLVEYLVEKYRVEPLVICFEDVSISDGEELIPAEYFPSGGFAYGVERGERYKKQVVTYHIPFEGCVDLLRCGPSSGLVWTTNVEQSSSEITFKVVNFSDQADDVKRDAESTIGFIRTQSANVHREVVAFNDQLEQFARSTVSARKSVLLKQGNLLAQLGVLVRRVDDVPSTFEVPVRRKSIAVKPTAPDVPFNPEVQVSDSDYQGILEVSYDLGVNMERHPSIYAGKDEESLRDLFIMQLSPHFVSVTGETFNKSGKTDILIRHEGANVFVAECKFWDGEKHHLATIDQILSYLTWRDSKAAVICFIRNRELDPVLVKLEASTQTHPCFVKHRGRIKPGWFQFEFHLASDPTRRVFLAVLCFHLP